MGIAVEAVREAHRRFVTGVTVVTAFDGDLPRGLAVNAFSSVSIEPPLVSVWVSRGAATHDVLTRAGRWAVNILAAGQADVARRFAESGDDKFAGIDWYEGSGGCPILEGVSAAFEVETDSIAAAGTHTLFIARVLTAVSAERLPLVYFGGRLHEHTVLEGAVAADA
jgi:flavin reductase (DIM6/NTAB) family NADH-FMN oxidoreductase RutF